MSCEEMCDCKIRRLKFTEREDVRLKTLIETLGTGDWKTIASHMSGRTARQCRDRWKNYLSPHMEVREWTPEEDKLLLQKLKEIGGRWTMLASFFPGRSGIAVRNRCCKLSRQKNADPILEMVLFMEARKRLKADVDDVRELVDCCEDDPKKLPSCASVIMSTDSTRIYPIFKNGAAGSPRFIPQYLLTQPPLKVLPPAVVMDC